MNASKEKYFSIGAVLAAILASSCCWLPLLLAAIGAGSAVGLASVLTEYRMLFGIIAFAVLGLVFYFTYRKPKESINGAKSNCCAPQSLTSRVEMFNKIMLWIVTAFVIVLVFFPDKIFSGLASMDKAKANEVSNNSSSENLVQVELRVDGMI